MGTSPRQHYELEVFTTRPPESFVAIREGLGLAGQLEPKAPVPG
jgi:hypothetical protein